MELEELKNLELGQEVYVNSGFQGLIIYKGIVKMIDIHLKKIGVEITQGMLKNPSNFYVFDYTRVSSIGVKKSVDEKIDTAIKEAATAIKHLGDSMVVAVREIQKITDRIAKLEDVVETMDGKLYQVFTDINENFKIMDENFDNIGKDFDDIEEIFDDIREELEEINSTLEDQEEALEDIDENIEEIEQNVEDNCVSLCDLEESIADMKKDIKCLDEDLDGIYEDYYCDEDKVICCSGGTINNLYDVYNLICDCEEECDDDDCVDCGCGVDEACNSCFETCECTDECEFSDLCALESEIEEESKVDYILKFIDILREDSDYYQAWKDNIAMAFKDTWTWYKRDTDKKSSELNKEDRHIIANRAADHFLSKLITTSKVIENMNK